MLLKLGWHKLKLYCYNFRMLKEILMVITKKIAIEDTQKEMRKEFNISLQKNQLNTGPFLVVQGLRLHYSFARGPKMLQATQQAEIIITFKN